MLKTRVNIGIGVVVLLAFIPVIIWANMQPLSTRVENWTIAWTSVGQISGLVGMALYSTNLILSSRMKWLEEYFNGLNRIYLNHHTIGSWAFIVLLVHPISLAIRYIPLSLWQAAQQLVPWLVTFDVFLGFVAFIVMMILMIMALYLRPKYNIWKFTHKFLGVGFGVAFFHMILGTSDVSRSGWLMFYMVALAVIGFILASRRSWAANSLVKKYKYVIKEVKRLNPMVTEVVMMPQNNGMQYMPGQFVFTKFYDEAVSSEEHPFSISSGKNQTELHVAIKNSGDYTSFIKDLSPESEVDVEGPFGKFSSELYENPRQVWVAGGIGITPFLGMARSIDPEGHYSIDLYYSIKEPSEAVYLKELKQIEKVNQNFKVFEFFTTTQGRLTGSIIQQNSEKIKKADIFICGPSPMMKSLRNQFIDLGVNKKQIHSEEFALD